MALAGGDGEAAERWARSAVDHAFSTDCTVDQANAKLDLARILGVLERPDEAISEAQAALDLFEAKGDRAGGRADTGRARRARSRARRGSRPA